jgi:hypothetical protein
MNIQDKITIVEERLSNHRSLIEHLVLRTPETGIDFSDPEESFMIESFIEDQQAVILELSSILSDLKNGIDIMS